MANKFKKSDKVIVITGKDKGKTSEITSFAKKGEEVFLKDVNLFKKHMKASKDYPEGGIVNKEMPIHISNISHIDPETNLPCKIGFKILDGKKVRYLKKTGKLIDNKKV